MSVRVDHGVTSGTFTPDGTANNADGIADVTDSCDLTTNRGAGVPNANTNYAPSYIRWDAMLSYEQRYWALRFNLFNVFDTVYYETVYQGHVIPGTSRVLLGTLELRY